MAYSDGVGGIQQFRKALSQAGLTAVINPPLAPFTDVLPLGEADWVRCSDLIDNPDYLGRIVRSMGLGLKTDEPAVMASIFVQFYSSNLLNVAVSCLLTSGIVPDCSSSKILFALGGGTWPRIGFLDPAVLVLGKDSNVRSLLSDQTIADAGLRFLVNNAFELHLWPLIIATIHGIGGRVGERMLRGNTAWTASLAFRGMEGSLGPWVRSHGERFFTIDPKLQNLGDFFVIRHEGLEKWIWERTSCCLGDHCRGFPRCLDCSLTPVGVRRRVYRDALSKDLQAK